MADRSLTTVKCDNSMIGQMLVAPPAQDNEFWEKSVVFIYEQTQSSTVGLIVNKPSERKLSDLAEHHDLDYTGDELLYVGGPVNPSALVMLHTDDWVCTNTMHIGGQWRISSDRTMLSRICKGDAPRKWRLFLGMSVWSPMQLEGEIKGNPPWNKKTAWVTAPATESIIFSNSPDRAWKKSIDLAAQSMVSNYFTID
jgi:putative transcriptional regulator